jgi:hypothetical protein
MRPDPTLIGWYYKRGEQRIGPLPLEQVAQLLSAGRLLPTDMLIEIREQPTPEGPTVAYSYLDAASAVRNGAAGADGHRRASPRAAGAVQ